MPGSSKKPLYLAKSVGELNKMSEAIPKITDARKAVLSAEKLFKSAQECVMFGDEEKGYVLYMRFFNVVKVIKKAAEYRKNEKYFDNLIGRKNCETAITSAEKLAQSLNDRYDETEAKKASEKIELTRTEDEKRKKEEEDEEQKLKEEKEEEERKLKEEEEKKRAHVAAGTIGVRQLYDLLLDPGTTVLILDVRSQEHFYASHMKMESCVNVPFNIVPPGSTVTSIEKGLSDESKGNWMTRGQVDQIVLIDWKSSLHSLESRTPISSLKDAIFKWDSTTIIKSEPLVLEGGYENWLLHYPTFTTNANVTPPANSQSLNNVPSLDDIDYDLDFFKVKPPPQQPNGVNSNGDVPLNNQVDLKRLNSLDKNNLKDVAVIDKEPWNDKEKVDNRILSEMRGGKVKNTNVISQGGTQPPQINRANKPQTQSVSRPKTDSPPPSTVTEAEWNAVHQAKEIKREELERYERETKRLVAEQKSRRAKLQDEERQLEKLAVMKKAELKETADLMRQKRKIQQELDNMKQLHVTRTEEEKKRQDEFLKLKDEEEEKLSRMQEVERMRALRKIKETEERARKQEEEQRTLEAMEKARQDREIAEKKSVQDRERELAEMKRIEEERRKKAEAERIRAEAERMRAEKEAQEKARREAEAKAAKENALKEAAAKEKAKSTEVGSAVDTAGAQNLPPGWKKVLEPTTGRYGYIDMKTGYLHWQPPIPDSPARTPKVQTYKAKLKDEEDAGSGQGGLKRSHSSPNIAKMAEDEKPVVIEKPAIPRVNKPKPAVVQVPQFIKVTEVSGAKVRNLKPAWGSVMPGLTGLQNMGNTCYMNSIIQCMSNTSFLTAYFLHDKYRLDINRENFLGTKGEITEEFAVLVKALWSGQYRSITPVDFKDTIAKFNVTFAGYEQQDSQELLLFLMDGLHEDLNRIRKRPKLPEMDTNNLPDQVAADKAWVMHKKINDSIIVDLFQGLLKSTITCLTCRTSSSKFDAFMYLSLPIPSATRCTLRDCLKHFSKTEEMTGESRWNCPNCRCKRNAEKKLVIWKLPPVLLIHLKRFYYKGIWRQKITAMVDFPLDGLNLNEHVAGPHDKGSFKLYGVSNHYGTMEGGHYTAYCKHPAYGSWFKYDDKEVNQIDPSVVKTSAAYTLFYTSLHQELRIQ